IFIIDFDAKRVTPEKLYEGDYDLEFMKSLDRSKEYIGILFFKLARSEADTIKVCHLILSDDSVSGKNKNRTIQKNNEELAYHSNSVATFWPGLELDDYLDHITNELNKKIVNYD
ncbi:MAG: hypothetical protein MHPSP_003670, partial [Paramarteilia canceri]